MIEREVKLSFDSPDQARAALVAVRATLLRPRRLQHDILFDTRRPAVAQRRGARCGSATKAIAASSRSRDPWRPASMKVREEHETTVADVAAMRQIIEGPRLSVVVHLSRSTGRNGRRRVVIIAVDETPVGTWMELEGSEASILEVARRARPYAVRLRPGLVPDAVSAAPRATGARRRHGVSGAMIPALVLTAGLATRLRPLSLVRAKAALPVAGQPLVRRILRSWRPAASPTWS